MSFPRRLLSEGEDIVVDVHPHWWYLAGPIAVVVVVLVGAIATAVFSVPAAASWAAVVVLVVAFGWLIVRYLKWVTTSLVITNHRLIDRHGVLSKNGREIPLHQLSDISYRQTFFGRIIGSGDLILESSGRDSQETFPDLPKPATIQNQIYQLVNQINSLRTGGYPPSAPPPGPGFSPQSSIPEQIAQLDQLRQQGILTQAEFDAKKAELLNRL